MRAALVLVALVVLSVIPAVAAPPPPSFDLDLHAARDSRGEFRVYALASLAASLADAYTTTSCFNCEERNPLYGDSKWAPAVHVALDLAAIAWADHLRIRHPDGRWRLIPAAVITAHGVGFAFNLRR